MIEAAICVGILGWRLCEIDAQRLQAAEPLEPIMTLEGGDGSPEEMAQLSQEDVAKLTFLYRAYSTYQADFGGPSSMIVMCGYQGPDGVSLERVARAYQILVERGYAGELLIGPESFCRRYFQYEIAINTVFRI